MKAGFVMHVFSRAFLNRPRLPLLVAGPTCLNSASRMQVDQQQSSDAWLALRHVHALIVSHQCLHICYRAAARDRKVEMEYVEFAVSDDDLRARLRSSIWLLGKDYTVPVWIQDVIGEDGEPSLISNIRLKELRDGRLAASNGERRFIRNKAVVKQIAAELERAQASSLLPTVGDKPAPDAKPSDRHSQIIEPPLGASVSGTPSGSTGFAAYAENRSFCNATPVALDGESASSSTSLWAADFSADGLATFLSQKTAPLKSQNLQPQRRLPQAKSNSAGDMSKREALVQPPQDVTYAPRVKLVSTILCPFGTTSSPAATSTLAGNSPDVVELEAPHIRDTAHPWDVMRVQDDSETTTGLRLREDSKPGREDLGHETVSMDKPRSAFSQALDEARRGMKRKAATLDSPMRIGDETNGHNEYDTNGHLHYLAGKISKDLENPVPNETIHLCGFAPLRIMSDQPQEVLDLASEKLHTWPYARVPVCWRRLYEDASLFKAVKMLRDQSGAAHTPVHGNKRKSLVTSTHKGDWVSQLVLVLDQGLTLSGAPGRKDLFEAVFQQVENLIGDETYDDSLPAFRIAKPAVLKTQHPIARAVRLLDFEAFQTHLDTNRTPLITPGTIDHWPATELWHQPEYILRRTLGGRRLVPVEIGASYVEEGWTQKIMSMRDFMQTYLLNDKPDDVGYLAQHDLFTQIPALKNDVMVPDYCYTTPPPADAAALRTAGLNTVRQLEEPLLNAWLGPKGTKTPLHTDPYHNILCQVVGYKYVRLYAPEETPNIYPCGTDEAGVNMENTSQVDVSHVRSQSLCGNTDLDAVRKVNRDFPLFKQAKYQEAVLGPGECLYIPLGWWHYVESLSTSFSVSFWWN